MSLSQQKRRALVTGGAGLIGSHIVDLLQTQGWSVRILDNLEPQTHRDGQPHWLHAAIQNGAEFVEGDIRDREIVESALDEIDVVFHQAAYGGYMPEISKYVAVNSFGTAQLLEIIREKNLRVRKIVVASSQGSGANFKKGRRADPGALGERDSLACQIGPDSSSGNGYEWCLYTERTR